MQLRLVQEVVPAVPDPAPLLIRRRDHRVDPLEIRREPRGLRPGPPELRPLPHQEGGPLLQGLVWLGTEASASS